MKHKTAPNPVNITPTLTPIFMNSKHSTIKHWRHSAQTNTLCAEPIAVEAHPTGISRECIICQRVKAQLDAERLGVTA
jgi:hypothetical protein